MLMWDIHTGLSKLVLMTFATYKAVTVVDKQQSFAARACCQHRGDAGRDLRCYLQMESRLQMLWQKIFAQQAFQA